MGRVTQRWSCCKTIIATSTNINNNVFKYVFCSPLRIFSSRRQAPCYGFVRTQQPPPKSYKEVYTQFFLHLSDAKRSPFLQAKTQLEAVAGCASQLFQFGSRWFCRIVNKLFQRSTHWKVMEHIHLWVYEQIQLVKKFDSGQNSSPVDPSDLLIAKQPLRAVPIFAGSIMNPIALH